MFILDLADNFLDKILDGDQPVDAAEFIDNKRQMPPPKPHFMKQVQKPDGRGDKQGRPQQGADIGCRPRMKMGEDILDVNDAGNVI